MKSNHGTGVGKPVRKPTPCPTLKAIVFATILSIPFGVVAAPFLVSNPDPAGVADICAYQDGTVVTRTPTVGNACHADLAGTTVGTHSLTVWFESTLWGQVSVSVPFTFGRPASGAAGPTGIGISKL